MTLPAPSLWRNIAGYALDLLLPPTCLSCDTPVSVNRTVCSACWGKIHFISNPFCARCGMPFEIPVEGQAECGGCLAEPPYFASARAVMLYNDASKPLILRFKHADRTNSAHALAEWMYRAGIEFWPHTDIILPVPLHRSRLFERRYNQAALLAQNLARLSRKEFLPDYLVRYRPTPPQGHMSRKERYENIYNAFETRSKHGKNRLDGRNVLLIDDVLTSGATVNECSRLMLAAGAKTVNVLVLARVRGGL